MAFNFNAASGPGHGNPAPAPSLFGNNPAPAPGGGGSLFGGAAPSGASGGSTFSFGSGTPAPAAAGGSGFAFGVPAPTGGGIFGGGTSAPAAPSAAPAGGGIFGTAPAAGGGLFGQTPASAPGVASTPAPTTAFSFSNAAPTPATGSAAAPTPTVFGGLGSSSSAAAPPAPATVTLPSFDATFENLKMSDDIQNCLQSFEKDPLAGQDLIAYTSVHASSTLRVKTSEWVAPNEQLRQQLRQKPRVGTDENDPTKVLNLDPRILEQALRLASDLRISEQHALCLYAEVSRHTHKFAQRIFDACIPERKDLDELQPNTVYDEVAKLASQIYFYERHLKLETILELVELRLEAQPDPDVMVATDSLLEEGDLISGLMNLVKDYSARIKELVKIVRDVKILGKSFAHVLLTFCLKERQMASEALLLIAHQTQFQMKEVIGLVDLLKELSQQLYEPSPLRKSDAPDPYENDEGEASALFLRPKEKDPLDWQEELFQTVGKSGQTQLSQCISLLLVAGVSTMTTCHTLHNRDIHGPNLFGVGNMLLPPNQPSVENLRDLFTRLGHNAIQNWNHKGIFGVLACSFSLMLYSAPSVMASPGKSGSAGSHANEVRDAAKKGLRIPLDCMSFSFCRLTLLPALQKLTDTGARNCDVSEFGCDVFTDFFTKYLRVLEDLPNSRNQWEEEAKYELDLLHEKRANQEKFEMWAHSLGGAQSDGSKESLPSRVDLMDRPECLDDLIALAAAICSLGPNFAERFWSVDETSQNVVPCQVLQECLEVASQDESLVPSVLSWLAVLSFDETRANAVYDMLSIKPQENSSVQASDFAVKNHWQAFLLNILYYAQQLDPNSSSGASTQPLSSMTSSTGTAGYYYNWAAQEEFNHSAQSGYSSQQGSSSTKSSSSSSESKTKKLSESAAFAVTSSLAVIMNTCLYSAKARQGILSIKVGAASGAQADHDALTILFNFVLCPIAPPLRGATLSTIACLFRPVASTEDASYKSFLDEKAIDAWKYVDQCSFVPIALLDRFTPKPALQEGSHPTLHFPTSSLKLASSRVDANAVLPNDSKYGLIYVMEHIESKIGWYPSIEGFLDLMYSLICAVGCPSTLGKETRARSGCTPYIEYVANFVLPRALGVNGKAGLQFRVPGDKSRLVAKALAVIDAVITRYELSPVSRQCFGIEALRDEVQISSNLVDPQSRADDFSNKVKSFDPTPGAAGPNTILESVNADTTRGISAPVPKSPGFTVLAEILSPSRDDLDLFQVLAKVLVNDGGPDGVYDDVGRKSNFMALAYALFGRTPVTFESAIEGQRDGGPKKPLQSFLKPIFPRFFESNVDEFYFDNATSWREHTIALALNILCAAAYREDAFLAQLNEAENTQLKLFPVLQFVSIPTGLQQTSLIFFQAVDLNAVSLKDRFFSISNSRHLQSTLVNYIGYDERSNHSAGAGIAARAMSLVHFMQQKIAPGRASFHDMTLSLLSDEWSKKQFCMAVTKRFTASSNQLDQKLDSQVLCLILNWMLKELREKDCVQGGLAQVLLGLTNTSHFGRDCFDAILGILTLKDIALQSFEGAKIASLCYEIFFRLYNMFGSHGEASKGVALDCATRLRHVNFWKMSVERLSDWNEVIERDNLDSLHRDEVFHCMAWLLKGVSCEIQLLVGFKEDSVVASRDGGYHPSQCGELLHRLYQGDRQVAEKLIRGIPLECSNNISPCPLPRGILDAAEVDLIGPADVVEKYMIIDQEKARATAAGSGIGIDFASAEQWIDKWNRMTVTNCAVSHLAGAVSILVEASLWASVIIDENWSQLARYDPKWMYRHGAAELLSCILDKLDISFTGGEYQGIDSNLIPDATSQLSSGVLSLADFISSSYGEYGSPADLIQMSARVSRILGTSCIGNVAAGEIIIQIRSVMLGGALVQLLQPASSAEPALVMQHISDFARAADVLAKASCISQGSEVGKVVSVKARSYLSSLVMALSTDDSEMNNSFVYHWLSNVQRSFLDHIFELVKNLDKDVCDFLCVVGMQPYGAELLVTKGIGPALKEAAIKYNNNVASNPQQSTHLYNSGSITHASVLSSHFKLMCSLLTSFSGTLPGLEQQFAYECTEVMQEYELPMERLIGCFPEKMECLHWGVRCLLLAFSVGQPLVTSAFGQDDDFKRQFTSSNFVKSCVPMLVEHLLENPLPKDMLPRRFPQKLQRDGEERATWWELLMNVPATHGFDAPTERSLSFVSGLAKNWTENTFKKGIAAMETCYMGLVLMQRAKIVPNNIAALARGLFCTMYAAGIVGAQGVQLSTRNNFMETDGGDIEFENHCVNLLANTLARCTAEALTLSLSLTDGNEIDPCISAAVSSNEGSLRFFPSDSREYISTLCRQINN